MSGCGSDTSNTYARDIEAAWAIAALTIGIALGIPLV